MVNFEQIYTYKEWKYIFEYIFTFIGRSIDQEVSLPEC